MTVEAIARVCHDANASYCRTIGDFTQPEWNVAPEWQRESALKGVEFHLDFERKHGCFPPASASHNSWLKEKRATGWKYGPVKDAERKEHPCFVPYEELPLEQRLKDYLFSAVVRCFVDAGAM